MASGCAAEAAAALGDGWYGVGHSPESAAVQTKRLRTLLAEQGRGDAKFENTVSHGARTLSRDEVARYAEADVHRVVILPWTRGREAEEAMKRLAHSLL